MAYYTYCIVDWLTGREITMMVVTFRDKEYNEDNKSYLRKGCKI